MSYKENLWNHFEKMHERYKKIYDCQRNLNDMLSRLQSASADYSKALRYIFQKNYQIVEDAYVYFLTL